MKSPIFVRTLSDLEKGQLETALRSKDAFVMRRAQILLLSERGERAPQIARNLGCGSQTVRDAIHDFNRRGMDALVSGSSRPKQYHAAFDGEGAEALQELLPRSPREFGRESTLWIESPDPEYERKRGSRPADRAGRGPPRVGSGFCEETWWSRFERPTLCGWSEEGKPLRLVEQPPLKDDPDPKALWRLMGCWCAL
jgi:hypothetical protein